jgi:hypothetical protein
MTISARTGRVALAVSVLAAGFAVLAVVVLSPARAAGTQPRTPMHTAMTMTMSPELTPKAVAFQEAMNKLWEDHITWTRMVIVDFAAGLPDLKTAEVRLLRNQADIGNAIKPYYGAAAGAQLTRLLRTHILEAVPVLVDAKAGDKEKLTAALNAWYANAHQIALFLSKANPKAWPLHAMDTMMKRHLALTTADAVARLEGHWAADVGAYDHVHLEILQMAHMLSTGIIEQFPSRFE